MERRLINGQIRNVELRRTYRNWPEEIKAIVMGYRNHTSIAHAVQKDAIQNGWSARVYDSGNGWNFMFELQEFKGRKYLIMTDSGTHGLTGRVLTAEEYESDLAPFERWGRFEGVAFTQNRSEGTLGSRGRGKFIFVGASKESTILYDTLRKDGIYRFGFRTVERTESPVAAVEGEEGKRLLLKITEGSIRPLTKIGTRVIIVNPLNEVIDDIESGRFIRYINETWWEIILKKNANILVKASDKIWKATVPEEFKLEEKDSNNVRVWLKRNQRISSGYSVLKSKMLHIVYSKNPLPEDIRGISIQRSGMKICTVKPVYIMPQEINERLYGYINFEPPTEEILLEDEGVEHYSYDFRRSAPNAVKRFIEDEILRFARKKLGYGADEREVRRRRQAAAEKRALIVINNFTRELGMGTGPITGGGNGGGGPARRIRIRLDELILPRPKDLRVNYGESIKNIKMQVINKSDRDILLRVRLFLRFHDKEIKIYIDEELQLKSNSSSKIYGPFEEKFNEADYPDTGRYTLTAKITSLMDENKTYKYDHKTKSFYLEKDPPDPLIKGIFERCEAEGFPEDFKYWMGYSESGSERGLILRYNSNHPAYKAVSESDEELVEYILRLAMHEVCRFDLMQPDGVLFKDDQRSHPAEAIQRERNLIGEVLYKFRKGEL